MARSSLKAKRFAKDRKPPRKLTPSAFAERPERSEKPENFRVFLTNDDGIQAEGLIALARALSPLAEITIVAPDGPRSAASHSITLHKPLRLTEVKDFPWTPKNTKASLARGNFPRSAYKCSGSPSDCVMIGVLEIMKDAPPHLVVSGINDGPNLAEDLTYSGTVSAAMEGAIIGFPSIAVSLARFEARNFKSAAKIVKGIIASLFFGGNASGWRALDIHTFKKSFGEKLFLNVNIPDTSASKIKGVKVCKPGFRGYKDIIQKMADPRGRPFYWIAGERVETDTREETDVQAVANGYVAVTPLTWEIFYPPAMKRLKKLL